ncbi:MAG: hypothetical protein V1752_03160, partial [Candidatus Firestonebacteria bacterium]
ESSGYIGDPDTEFYVFKVNTVTANKTEIAKGSVDSITITATLDPASVTDVGSAIEWQRQKDGGVWEDLGTGMSKTLDSSAVGKYSYRARAGNGDTWVESGELIVYRVSAVKPDKTKLSLGHSVNVQVKFDPSTVTSGVADLQMAFNYGDWTDISLDSEVTLPQEGPYRFRARAGNGDDWVYSNVIDVISVPLFYLSAYDYNTPERNSETEIQMVAKPSESRMAGFLAGYNSKWSEYGGWNKDEPVWSGLYEKNIGGDSSGLAVTSNSGTETATAGGISKTVNVKIVPYYKNILDTTIGQTLLKIDTLAGSVSAVLGGGSSGQSTIAVKGEEESVDNYDSPTVGNSYTLTVSGNTSKYQAPNVVVPGLGFSSPFVTYGVTVSGDAKGSLSGFVKWDPSKESPASGQISIGVSGKVDLQVGISVTVGEFVSASGQLVATIPISVSSGVYADGTGFKGVPSLTMGPTEFNIEVTYIDLGGKIKIELGKWKPFNNAIVII